MIRPLTLAAVAVAFVSAVAADEAPAKGFFATVPTDGVELRYEGTVRQTEFDPFGGREEFAFDRVVTIRAFGPERAERDGETVDAWWVEIEVATGTATERGIEAGPGGRVTVAALIAEGDFGLERGGPASHQPVLKAFRRIDDGPTEQLPDGVLRLDPVFTFVPDFRPDEVASAEPTSVAVAAGRYEAESVTGTFTVESTRVRTKTDATVVTSSDVPVGPVKWAARFEQSGKESTKPREEFRLRTEIDEAMELVKVGSAFSMSLDVR